MQFLVKMTLNLSTFSIHSFERRVSIRVEQGQFRLFRSEVIIMAASLIHVTTTRR